MTEIEMEEKQPDAPITYPDFNMLPNTGWVDLLRRERGEVLSKNKPNYHTIDDLKSMMREANRKGVTKLKIKNSKLREHEIKELEVLRVDIKVWLPKNRLTRMLYKCFCPQKYSKVCWN